MVEYIEIDNPAKIIRLHELLAKKLKKALPHVEDRTIGYPRGNFKNEVRFLSNSGNEVFYWGSWVNKKQETVGSFFGHGEPNTNTSLNMDVQFNLPMVEFSREKGGVFLKHLYTDKIIVAHRGIVTLGHGRVSKSDLFSEIAATVREAKTGNKNAEFLLIGELESPTLISEIDTFSSELRRAVKIIKANKKEASIDKSKVSPNSSGALADKLKQYYDEFSGKSKVKGRKQSTSDCYHGTVLKAICDCFNSKAEKLKNQAIDLTVIDNKTIYLFEVKTSSKPQSAYTAIGQLIVHTQAVAKLDPLKEVVKVMVLPEKPNPRICSTLKDTLGIRLLTFTRSARGNITIDNIEQLKP